MTVKARITIFIQLDLELEDCFSWFCSNVDMKHKQYCDHHFKDVTHSKKILYVSTLTAKGICNYSHLTFGVKPTGVWVDITSQSLWVNLYVYMYVCMYVCASVCMYVWVAAHPK